MSVHATDCCPNKEEHGEVDVFSRLPEESSHANLLSGFRPPKAVRQQISIISNHSIESTLLGQIYKLFHKIILF